MNEEAVIFKGTKNGISVILNNDVAFEEIKESLKHKLDDSGDFFKKSNVKIVISGKKLDKDQQDEVRKVFSMYDNTSLIVTENELNIIKEEKRIKKINTFNIGTESQSLFIRKTIRNGQRIRYGGNIIIVGDVNPGAEIIAEENIIVLGTLRGMAHAGAFGDKSSIVVAFRLLPMQLRIGSIITRPPEGDCSKSDCPEIAYIKDGVIVIEPYLSLKRR